MRDLEEENERLKKIIPRQALELEVKSELLKKSFQIKTKQDKKMIVHSHESLTTLENLLSWVNLSKSSFYYKSSDGKRGAKPSGCTFRQDRIQVDDTLVIEEIKGILSQEFCCYGYHNITDELREMGYIINHKKVYRLMKGQNLLLGTVISTSGKRQFVKHRKIEATRPMEYVWI